MMRAAKILVFILLVSCAGRQEKAYTIVEAVPRPLDVILMLDQSSSMKWTDSLNNRIEASKFLVGYLATYWSKEQGHRVGLVNFGSRKPLDPTDEFCELVSLDTAELDKREGLLQRIKPMDLQYTSFINTFRNTRRIFSEAEKDRDRQKVMVLLTDGEPDDLRKLSRRAYFEELVQFFEDSLKDCHLYVLGIDQKDRYWSKTQPYWQRITEYTERITSAEEKNLKETFWRVVSEEMEGTAGEWELIPEGGLKVELAPYLEAVTFTIHKELPEAKVRITDPKGVRVVERPPTVRRALKTTKTEVWRIEEPEAGTWICQIEKGKGKVEVGTVRIPVQPRLLSPKDTHPQGKPFVIYTSFLRKDGRPIRELRAYKLAMSAALRTPSDTALQYYDLVETRQTGLFVSRDTIMPGQPGKYGILLSMKAQRLVAETVIPIRVVSIPYVEVLQPTADEVQPWRRDVVIKADVRLESNTINPTELFVDNPNTMISYQLSEGREVLGSGHLQYRGGEREAWFSANAGKLKKNGVFRIVASLNARRADGTVYEYSNALNPTRFRRRMDFVDFVVYRFYILLALILFGFFIWDWQRIGRENNWWGWRIGYPQLAGSLDIIRTVLPEKAEEPQEETGESQKEQKAKAEEVVTADELAQLIGKQPDVQEEEQKPEEETPSVETRVVTEEELGIRLSGRKMQFERLGITLVARKIKAPDEFGEAVTKSAIFIRWHDGHRPEEELKAGAEEIPISKSVRIRYNP